MNRAQLFLIAILCVVSLQKYVGADKVEQGHRDSHHEKDYVHHRAKRYTRARIPVHYLYNRLSPDDDYAVEKRYRSDAVPSNPVASHFRELQVRQAKRPSPPEDEYLSSPQMQSYRNLLQYSGRNSRDTDFEMQGVGDEQALPQAEGGMRPLSDDDLQSLLLLLEEYRHQGNPQTLRNFYSPPPQYFTPEMEFAGTEKRETGKRANNRGPLVLEQPMSFENSLGGDGYPVFISQKRSKRVGSPALTTSVSNTRIKKETDPEVEAELDKVFGSASATDQEAQAHTPRHSTAIPTTSIASSNQIPPPSGSQKKPKKAIDWSDYFGIDKRQGSQKHVLEHYAANPSSSNLDAINHGEPNNTPNSAHDDQQQTMHNPSSAEGKDGKTATSSTTSSSNLAANVGAKRDSQASKEKGKNEKEKKEDATKQENHVDDKADRTWILNEFYKNLAMSSKKKRESPAPDASNDIDKLEKIERKMQEAGDQIIWDALKFTGAHRDAELSPEELAQVKNQIIQKLAAAYSLEKVREAIEEFRQQLGQLKNKQQYY